MNTNIERAARSALVLLFGLALAGCAAAAGTASGVDSAEAAKLRSCADGKIDDLEDGDGKTAAVRGRGGYWYTYADKGSKIEPLGKFLPSPSGAGRSRFAARARGRTGDNDVTYAGVGFSFVDPKGPYDASAYQGIAFKARAGKGSVKEARLKVSDGDTDPEGKACRQCFNDFGADLTLGEEWKTFKVPFASMQQEVGWGDAEPALDPRRLFGFMIQVKEPGSDFDLWVDDVEFLCR